MLLDKLLIHGIFANMALPVFNVTPLNYLTDFIVFKPLN